MHDSARNCKGTGIYCERRRYLSDRFLYAFIIVGSSVFMSITKTAFLIIIVLGLLVPFAHAENIKNVGITLDIKIDSLVSETNKYLFSTPLTGNTINYTVDGTVSNIRVFDDSQQLDYALNNNTIQIFLRGSTNTITISYDAADVIFRSDSVSHFFTEYMFDQDVNLSVQLKLPAGYGIYQNSYKPANAIIGSDGERIIISWDEYGNDVLFSVKYTNLGGGNNIILFIVAIIMLAAIIYLYLHSRKKMREEFISGFREDEKKTIEYLEQRKIALQSDLQKEFKFSRAKATRIVMKLEEKGLVRKQRYGRTNRLYWIKK